MNRFNYSIFFTCIILLFSSSCEKLDGLATPPDFDAGPHIFGTAVKDTVLISKNDQRWWFERITVDGFDDYDLERNNKLKCYRRDANPNADSPLGEVYKYESAWFTVEKLDERHIKISLKENKEGVVRTFTFSASVGNANRKVTVVQNQK